MIAIGADHGGFQIKEAVKKYLEEKNIPFQDFGSYDGQAVDYPKIAIQVAHAVTNGEAEKGILCCGTGIGISIAANKVKGVRAAVITDEFCAEMSRRHNDANILCMGGRVINDEKAVKFAEIFLNTPFDGGRHARRVGMITKIEQEDKC